FGILDDAAGHADDGRPRRHFLNDDGVGADACALADDEAAQDLGAGAYHHTGAERRMTFRAAIERRAAERHALVDSAAVADLGGLADHHAHAVVDEDAGADFRARVDFDAGEEAPEMRGEAPEPLQSMQPEAARELVDPDRVQTRIAGQHLPSTAGRRVALEDAGDIAAQLRKHASILEVPD